MKILYDYQIFQSQKIGGISKYFTEIIAHFAKKNKFEVAILVSNNKHLSVHFNHLLKPRRIITTADFFKKYNFRGKLRVYHLFKRIFPFVFNEYNRINYDYSTSKLKRNNFDIFHPTYYDPYFLDFLKNKPFVLTVHDMIHEKFIELFHEDVSAQPTIENKKKLIIKASHIIAISENTKKDIIEIYGVSESKISVVYHATSILENQYVDLDLPKEYILFVGSRYNYKNFRGFVESIAELLIENEMNLLCIGQAFNPSEIDFLKELNIQNHCHHKIVNDSELYQIYNSALFFVFPSYYEGFGIPVLEAFQSRCPVLLSNTSCFPEIAQDAAIYFDPYIKKDMREKVEYMIQNKEVREDLIRKGTKRVQDFNWTISSEQTAEVYLKVLKNS
jgi:glycosyltransferase involved in cell wall biosynthesis